MSAVLRISADPADVRRALSGVADEAIRQTRRIGAEEQKQHRESARSLREQQRDAIRAAQDKERAEEKASRKRERLAKEEQRRLDRIKAQEVRDAKDAERDKTRAAERESRERTRIAEKEAREATQIARARARQQARIDREIRQQYKRDLRQSEVDQRYGEASYNRTAGAIRRGAGFAAQVGGAAFSNVLSSTTEARAVYGSREHNINAALFQAGITGQGAASARSRIQQFLLSSQGRGLSGDEVSAALLAAQTQTSLLTKPGGLDNFLQNATLARNTYQDVGEVTRVGGILGNLGLTGADQRAALLSLTGIAQAGSIELKDVSSTALQGVQMAIGQALGVHPGISGEARSRLISDTAAQAMAVTEVGGAAGLTPRDSLNAYNKLTRNLQNEGVAEKMREALHARYNDKDFAGIDSQMFEAYQDARGVTRHRMRITDPLQFGQKMTELFGGNIPAMINALSAGGPGSMVMDAQVRRLLGTLSAQGPEGTGWQQVMKMRGQTLTEARVQEGAGLRASEIGTQDIATRESSMAALMSNREMAKVPAEVAAYRAQHPWWSSAINSVGSIVGSGDALEAINAKMEIFLGRLKVDQPGVAAGGAAGAAGAANAIPVNLSNDSVDRLARAISNVNLTVNNSPLGNAIESGHQANQVPPEFRSH